MQVEASGELERFFTTQFRGRVFSEEPLAPYTWYKAGGTADFLAFPQTLADIQALVSLCSVHAVPYGILGDGANLLVHDRGFRGVMVCLKKDFAYCTWHADECEVGAGALLATLGISAEQHARDGFAALAGIPGTVGGALCMNAGTDQATVSDHLVKVACLDVNGALCSLNPREIGFGYRSAPALQDKIILRAWFAPPPGNPSKLADIRKTLLQKRRMRQPLEYPSCGSVFKRPPHDFAGRLIEAAGLKGYAVGRAMVSPKHAGFIVNTGGARSADILACITHVYHTVALRFGVFLEPEVRFVGFTDSEFPWSKT